MSIFNLAEIAIARSPILERRKFIAVAATFVKKYLYS